MSDPAEKPITRLIWIDLEMTGLNPDQESILEIATVITDTSLQIIAEGPNLVVHHPQERLMQMDPWCTQTHQQSGLWNRVLQSSLSMAEVEEETLDFLQSQLPAKSSPMCGNSICLDRRFLHRYMPRLEAYFHYRHLDVSSFKIAAQLWAPQHLPQKNLSHEHQALADILESIAELRAYYAAFFKQSIIDMD